MAKIFKNLILIIFIVFVIIAGSICVDTLIKPTANVYIDNDGVACSVTYFDNKHQLEEDICDYVLNELKNYDSNVDSVKEGVKDIGNNYGIHDLNVNIDSQIGANKLFMVFEVEGKSMVPTLQDGQSITVEKTKDIAVDDIVVANSSEYGIIVKRVNEIEGDKVHLISDNKNVEYKTINGEVYELKGVTTWVDISNIYGVVKL